MTEQRVLQALGEAYAAVPPDPTVEQLRVGIDAIAREIPDGVAVQPRTVGGIDGLWITPAGAEPGSAVLLHLHGGGYVCGSALSHRDLVARVAAAAGREAFLPDYRLAPEHRHPAAIQDVLAVIGALAADGRTYAVAGDSAGAGLALGSVAATRDAGLPGPTAVVTMSAWADLTLQSPTFDELADVDLLVRRVDLQADVDMYLGPAGDAADPLVSPVFSDLTGHPPLLLQTGGDEVLSGDSARLATAAVAAGVRTQHTVYPGMPHVFQMMWWALPEAVAAIDEAAGFLRAHDGGTTA
ncbi:alpha/beta hydrolase fold domain-containing protein [Nakamurella sp. YIM 132087]|uniref:Alpha/beta hydrolase fold domain-containing protein n=1 Tax=Nakamurella alba TaxID=2665158 RepID=A0A7K1FLE0_9ACTN|nr:alpha/beta hydrolase [Nakamurella alba]MTD14199.1 alpha/beta hydrolase fold domain-containing protein [Nakamurella alba]